MGMMVALLALTLSVTAMAQEAPPDTTAETPVERPAVDTADPQAVVQAYMDACREGDAEAAIGLTGLEGAERSMVLQVVSQMEMRPAGVASMDAMVREVSFLPTKSPREFALAPATADGDTMKVVATAAKPETRTFVLTKAEDGTWRIDLEKSILATTGGEQSFLFMQVRSGGMATRARRPEDGPVDPLDWQVRNTLQKLTRLLTDYAQAKGTFPYEETWMDDLAEYALDPAALDFSALFGDNIGVAMDASISGQRYPEQWDDRQNMVALYVTHDPKRNAAGDPDAEMGALPEGVRGMMLTLVSGETIAVPREMSVMEALASAQQGQECSNNLRAIVQALIHYAREHEGKLPAADEWCEGVQQYIAPERVNDMLFMCPAVPDMECAWAINKALAGKDIRTIKHHDRQVLLMPAQEGVWNEARDLPLVVEAGRHVARWHSDPKLLVYAGMLNGDTQSFQAENPYPRAPTEQGE